MPRRLARRAPDTPVAAHFEHPTVFPAPAAHHHTVCDALLTFLVAQGVRLGFGLVGGPIAPFCASLQRSSIEVVHCRHEGGAGFAATESCLASGRPAVLFVTTGPGLLNALSGIAAARLEGAKLIVISGCTAGAQRGRGAAQESSGYTLPLSGLYQSGPLFDFATVVEQACELPEVVARLQVGLRRPQGFVAHVALPVSVQTEDAPAQWAPGALSWHTAAVAPATIHSVIKRLVAAPFALWLGFGARNAAEAVHKFAQVSGCSVMCSPRAKGIFPENHPNFVGVTGLGGHPSLDDFMAAVKPRHILVLGTRLGEGTSYWSTRLVPSGGFVHVDVDSSAFGAAYPQADTLGVQAEIGAFLEALLELWPVGQPPLNYSAYRLPAAPVLLSQSATPVRPQWVMQAVQRGVIDAAQVPVMAESGNTFTWGNHLLRFSEPGRYRVSPGFGAMGHFTTGVVGAALARGSKVLAMVGDGAMLMNNEVSTAVRYGAQAIWLVLNDSQYGMVEQGMRALGYPPVETPIPPTNFAVMAQAQGALGLRVEQEGDLPGALHEALRYDGPVVLDVVIDPSVASPLLQRIECLKAQGAKLKQTGERS